MTHGISASSTTDNPRTGNPTPQPADSQAETVKSLSHPPIRLACIEVSNFRRLAETRLEFDEATTILVGANNSGKTSAIEAMLTFLQRPIKHLSINDFSLGCRDAFKKFEQHVLTPPAASAPPGGDAAVAAPPPVAPPLPDLPILSLRLKFDYDDTGPDLAIAGELLMDLEEKEKIIENMLERQVFIFLLV